jgi:low affinity Fe/Cu permease
MNELFRRFAQAAEAAAGSPWAFIIALALVLVWALTGPLFDFSERWQLIVNTGTTIVTFLMVFLIQNTENREAKAIQLKLDELIRAEKGARKGMVKLEDLSEEELEGLYKEMQRLRKRTRGGGGPPGRPGG